ncbi:MULTISPECIES: hypothetical protein [Flavobacterium]|uniref:hypothetical protein n=1 Tax=Flavobacterium TaxID=237 RepID=UPI001FCAB0FF|nr:MULTISPECIES: hypothetical protein [Flavobacterium]UOK42188.1 hypothetical protein LZF87_12820 [Flavobacterium enshiense]
MEWFGSKNPQLHKAGGTLTATNSMRNLKKLDVEKSIELKKLVYVENWFDKLDRFVIYIFFSWGFVLPFLIYFDPHRDYSKTGFEYYLIFILSLFCAYVVYRKATEKKLCEIISKYDAEENRKLINEYCEKMGYEKYRNSKNIIIYNTESSFNINPEYKISRIFLLDNKSVYLTMIKENYKLNIPVLFSQLILKKDIKKITKK